MLDKVVLDPYNSLRASARAVQHGGISSVG